ncbi:MAG: D-Ala-D-Ala carboxypeptidase family metallohydrolase [Bacteroidota bacterium]
MTFKTHIPLHPNDPTNIILVRNVSDLLTPNFKQSEFFQPLNGLSEHPIAMELVEAAQFLRTYFGIPIKITSSYRNYVPDGGVKRSVHMLGQAIDLTFLAVQNQKDDIFIQLRYDFDQRGPVFQELWRIGIRGFGSYDTFLHLDAGKPMYYDFLAAKAGNSFAGEKYRRWNRMSVLKNRRPSTVVAPTRPSTNTDVGVDNQPLPVVSYEPPATNVVSEAYETVKQFGVDYFYGSEDGYAADLDQRKRFYLNTILLGVLAIIMAFLAFRGR